MIFCISPDPYHDLHGSSSEEIRKLFTQLKNAGIGGVNVTYKDPDEHPEWVDYMKSVVECAGECDFRISMHAPATDISSIHGKTRELAVAKVEKSINDVGELIDDVVVVVHPENYKPDRQPGDDDARKGNCRKSMEELAASAKHYGIRLALENMRSRQDNPNRTGMYTDDLTQIISGIDENIVGICFDVGHANISEGHDLEGAFRRNAGRIIHIHLADNLGVDDDHLQPGEGAIDFEGFYGVMRASGYNGMVQLEVKIKEGDDPMQFYLRNYRNFVKTACPE